MKYAWLAGLVLGALPAMSSAHEHGHSHFDFGFGLNIGPVYSSYGYDRCYDRGYSYYDGAYYQPYAPPVYVEPPVTYYAPPPVVVVPERRFYYYDHCYPSYGYHHHHYYYGR